MTYNIKVIGSNSCRQIQSIVISAKVNIDENKCKKPLIKLKELEKELETIVEKYFEVTDWQPCETGIRKYY
jgi:hypothetical protein